MSKSNKKDTEKEKRKHRAYNHASEGGVAVALNGSMAADAAHASSEPMGKKEFERKVRPLHVELVKLQLWAQHTGARAIVIFEGRDAAGKGGAIKAITERVSPRVFRVVALPAPTEREKSQMYIQRYMAHFPAAGEIVLFDRSWYNRAGVEHVMGYCTDEQYRAFLELTPSVERTVVEQGLVLIKYWFEVSQELQTQRFRERVEDGRKIWKLSGMDLESHYRWYDYSRARDAMFAATDTEIAPWYVVSADDPRRARLNCISHLLSKIPYHEVPHEKIELGERQPAKGYVEPQWRRHLVPEVY